MSEHKEFIAQWWKDWFEREEKLKSEQMCMHSHSNAHEWKPLRYTFDLTNSSSEKESSKQICQKCLEIRDWFFYQKRK